MDRLQRLMDALTTYDPDYATERLARAREALEDANREYGKALEYGRKAGLTNVKMAAICGVTETAIRRWMQRHP